MKEFKSQEKTGQVHCGMTKTIIFSYVLKFSSKEILQGALGPASVYNMHCLYVLYFVKAL
jgi:hypothetical protein